MSNSSATNITPYQRAMAAFNRQEADRVPVFELMIDPRIMEAILPGATYADFVEAMDIDCTLTPTPSRMYSLELVDHDGDTPIYRTEWGELRAGTTEMVTIPVRHPLQTHAAWEAYTVPDPDKPGRLNALKGLVERFKGKRAVGCHLHDSFTYPSYLFGMSELFVNLVEEPEWVQEVIDTCLAHNLRMVELAVQAGADYIVFGDDVGGKAGPMMSPRHYEKFFLPGLAKVVAKAHELGAKVIKHTDGNIMRLLDMFIAAGVDAFHPSDPSSGMDIVEVKKRYGDRLTVCGGVDTGDPLSRWPVADLVTAVRERIRDLAPGGGWMIASSNTIHSSVQPQNYQAMLMAIHTYSHTGHLNEAVSPELEAQIGQIPIQL